MTRTEKDDEREERIKMEIIVDTYNADEQAMGWYAYPILRHGTVGGVLPALTPSRG